MKMKFRWFGAAGLEFQFNSSTILIDPYLSRHSPFNIIFAKLIPNIQTIKRYVSIADQIFVSHSHFDHISDIPEIYRITNADIYSTKYGKDILIDKMVPENKIFVLVDKAKIDKPDYSLSPIYGDHMPIIGKKQYLKQNNKIPEKIERSFHYCMDDLYNFFIEYNDIKILIWNSHFKNDLINADVLIIKPQDNIVLEIVKQIRPKLLVPVHWDKLWKKEIRNTDTIPICFDKNYSKVRAFSWNKFISTINKITPETKILIPEHNQIYNIQDYLQ